MSDDENPSAFGRAVERVDAVQAARARFHRDAVEFLVWVASFALVMALVWWELDQGTGH